MNHNPFAGYGTIASGDRFIGRRSSLQVLEDRVISAQKPGNLAIIGLPRIGKSSLAYQALIERKQELLDRKFLPIWIDLATHEQSSAFFRSLVKQSVDELKGIRNWLNDPMQRAANRALQEEVSSGEGYGRILRFFEKVRQAGIRVIFVLDEFDHACQLFKEDTAGFARLGELSDRPAWRVTFVTTSRRAIHEIERQVHATPSLDRLFGEHYLTMFDEQDLQEHFARLAMVGLPVSPMLKESIDFYTGGHPYLLEMLGYNLVFHNRQQDDVDVAAREIEQSFVDYYNQLVNLLREDGILDKLLQVLFSPGGDIEPTNVNELLRYGLIKPSRQGAHVAFSPRFQSFLRLMELESEPEPTWQETEESQPLGELEADLWPVGQETRETQPLVEPKTNLWLLWRETEKMLRTVLASVLQNKYGKSWFEDIEYAHPTLAYKDGKNVFQRCREGSQKEEAIWGSRAVRSLLEFTAPQELFALVSAEWSTFKPVFGEEQDYWRLRTQLLVRVRMLLAHNRAEAVYDFERRSFEEYCQEILEVLRVWREPESTEPAGEGQTDLWSLWLEVEKALRTVLASALRDVYGMDWFRRIEYTYPMLGFRDGKNVFQRYRELQQREVQVLGSRAIQSLLDFAYVQELFALIFAEWHTFQPIFGKDWVYWEQRAQLFAMMRNPLAHNREESIFGEKRQLAEDCCQEILNPLRTYLHR